MDFLSAKNKSDTSFLLPEGIDDRLGVIAPVVEDLEEPSDDVIALS